MILRRFDIIYIHAHTTAVAQILCRRLVNFVIGSLTLSRSVTLSHCRTSAQTHSLSQMHLKSRKPPRPFSELSVEITCKLCAADAFATSDGRPSRLRHVRTAAGRGPLLDILSAFLTNSRAMTALDPILSLVEYVGRSIGTAQLHTQLMPCEQL